MGLILDSSVAIAAERRGDTPAQLVAQVVRLAGDQETALSSVGLTELIHGIYRADTPQRRLRRESFIAELRAGMTVYPYTEAAAVLAGQINGERMAKGIIIPFPDLLIGATALSLGYSVANCQPAALSAHSRLEHHLDLRLGRSNDGDSVG